MPISKEVLKKYKSKVFFETGSAYGDGIQTALDCKFKYIYSCEPNNDLYKYCMIKFEDNPQVILSNMDSVTFLHEYLNMNSDTPDTTYWLDAHTNGRKDKVYNKPSPILDELNIIYNMHEDDNFIILIDDIRLFRRNKWGVKLDDIYKFISDNNLKFNFEDGYKKDDIMVIRG